ncbi:MAG: family transporter [Moraxellaceae bacterium]|jgi:predicted PurR-regulated permease PerM|nr:family transporter [Moraxellaceae bacterium]
MHEQAPHFNRRLILALFLGGLLLLAFIVLRPFLIPVTWAGILVYVTWPLYLRLRNRLPGRPNTTALLMTVLLALVLILPVVWLLLLMRSEVALAYQKAMTQLNQGYIALPPEVRRLPVVGAYLGDFFDRLNADPAALKAQVQSWTNWAMEHAGSLLGGVGRNLAKLGFALLTAFFLYRDGEAFFLQMRDILGRMLGKRTGDYVEAMGDTTRAVVYGIVLTAMAQGVLSGIGYAVAGVEGAVFLGAVTTLIAMVPFGTPFAWGSVSIWLMLQGQVWPAIGLALWGTLVVSWIDNIIRPLVISSATRIPFLLVMFGVLGGLAAFGMVGLFLGPVILAVMLAVWREWLEDAHEHAAAEVAAANDGKNP